MKPPNSLLNFTFGTPLSSFAQQPINYSITLSITSLNINTLQEGTLDNIINKNYINDTEEINYKILRIISSGIYARYRRHALREKCPNTELFLVRIFPHSD